MFRILVASAVVLAASSVSAAQTSKSAERAFLDSFCVGCHNSTRKVANVVLDTADVDRPASNAALWELVVRKLIAGLHPPASGVRPDRGAIDAFRRSLEGALDAAGQPRGTLAGMSDSALAARLARFFWDSEPDAQLTALAQEGRLSTPAVLEQQARRMLEDRRSDAFVSRFFGRWLHIRNLAKVTPDAAAYPAFDAAIRDAMQEETALFLGAQIREDRPAIELMTADYTFLNDRLAQYYGVANVEGAQFRRVAIGRQPRPGLLGHGSVLTVTSYAKRTSPVLRGKWVMEALLGIAPPPPPANVPPVPETAGTSMRARLAQHTRNPVCASCHATMDALGYAFEHFDAVGHWRSDEGGEPVDASGGLPDGTALSGAGDVAGFIADQGRDAFLLNVATQLLQEGAERKATPADMPAVRSVLRDAAVNGYRWSSLIVGVVKSVPFAAATPDPAIQGAARTGR